jgi:hypothetical protein
MAEGVVPQDWRTANVTPIFKKGSKYDPGNYRPVSLTSICGKIMEGHLKAEITRHLEDNKLLHSSQHGFTAGKSCTTNLLEFLEIATKVIDEGYLMDIIFLDFSKAFDKVPQRRLIEKLKAHGVGGRLLKWIQNWLTGRRQRVVLNGEHSDWVAVLSGVPQGSLLGPILFAIFINDIDLLATLVTIILKFADDTKLAQRIQSVEDSDKLQECLNLLMSWAERWGMAFNIKKCKVMHLGRHNPRTAYWMGDQQLEVTEVERDIGVLMNQSLKVSAQCSKAAQTANAVLGQISRAFHYRDRHTFVKLYKLYVRPHLEFAIPAWRPWTAGDIEVMEKVQRRAIRMVSGLRENSYGDRLTLLGLSTLEARRNEIDLAEMFKIMSGVSRVNSETWFERAVETGRVTRQGADYLNVRPKASRLDLRRNFFSVRICEKWNELPGEIKRSKNLQHFKKALRRHYSSTSS